MMIMMSLTCLIPSTANPVNLDDEREYCKTKFILKRLQWRNSINKDGTKNLEKVNDSNLVVTIIKYYNKKYTGKQARS